MTEKSPLPSVDELRALYDFDPATGVFRWRVTTSSRSQSGSPAGARAADGSLRLRIGGREIPASWAVIALATGSWPKRRVVFKNNDKSDHRISNLAQGREFSGKTLTAERLKELFSYDSLTGTFIRRCTTSGNGLKGSEPGCKRDGYIFIHVDRKLYRAHRLAWLYVYGQFPSKFIDHVNGNRADNRISNLRDVEQKTNNENRRSASEAAASKVLGVTPKRKKWAAQISVDNKNIYLGTFADVEAAGDAYVAAKRQLHAGNTL